MKTILLLLIACIAVCTAEAQTDSLPSTVYHIKQLPVQKDSSRNRIQIMDGATPYLTNLEVHITILEPGMSAHPPHTHAATEELIIVKEGWLKVTIAGKSKTIGPGGVAMAMAGDEHGAVNVGKGKAVYYLLKYTTGKSPDHESAAKAGGSVIVDWKEVAVNKTDRGVRRQQYNRPTSLFEKFDMHATTLDKGRDSHLPHTHREEEIILVKKGTIKMHIGDAFYDAAPGDLVFLNAFVPHALINTTDGQCEYFAFQWR
jgi:(S)-ureidoglycine aminohydrolase